jgi:beta-mannanase
MRLGIYRPDGLLDEENLAQLEREIGAPVAMVSAFRAWNRCAIEDDLGWLAALGASRREILLTWEPWRIPPDPAAPQAQPEFSLREILSGRYDAYIRSFAVAIRGLCRTVLLRPMHEMNGFWYPWCGTVNGNAPGEFQFAWGRLRRLFAAEKAGNVRWVWSPYGSSIPPGPENRIESYFPGDEEIDLTALDGYNWGTRLPEGTWLEFEEIFGAGYAAVTAISRKPVMVGETASAEEGGSKAAWIRHMARTLPLRFPRVETLVWFDTDKERDWRISSSPGSLADFREAWPALS